jgi:hypothetical protein
MKTKDLVIGILIIVATGLAGGLGFLVATWEPRTTTNPPTYLSGLPDDWSTAPNSTYLILNNQTHSNVQIYFEDILKGIEVYENAQASTYDTGIQLMTITDPETKIPITGISITDLFDEYYTYFPGDIEFASPEDDFGQRNIFRTSASQLLEKLEDAGETIMIAIAANQQWLQDSPLGDKYGTFALIGEAMDARIYDLEQINVLSDWMLDIYLDGELKLSLDPANITDLSYNYSYSYKYERTDDWGMNRYYNGVNLSMLCDWVGLDDSINFEVKARAADGWAAPHGSSRRRGLTEDEVYNGLEYDSYYWDYVNKTDPEDDGVPLPDVYDDLPILLAYEIKILGESDGTSSAINPAWPNKKTCGFGHGPYVLIIPGRVRSNQIRMINKIEIDTIPVVNFTANQTEIGVGDSVEFTFTGTVYNPPASYLWTFNTTLVNSTLQNPIYQFISTGNYTISLTVTDDDGSEAIMTKEEYIIVT